MKTHQDSIQIFQRVWPHICSECREVLGSELHYQAMIYRCFREVGKVPVDQIGMNVKIWVDKPITSFFRTREYYKHKDFRGGIEPVPDIVLFSPEIDGDFRRRNNKNTFKYMLMAIEVKASERENSRLTPGEICEDIFKLEAFRKEARHRKKNFVPTMVVLDTAPIREERMTSQSMEIIISEAKKHNVGLFYFSPDTARIEEWDLTKLSIE